MTPRHPHLLLVPALLLPLTALAGCSQDPAEVAVDPGSPGTAPATPSPSSDQASGDRLPDDLPLDLGMHRDDTDATVEGPGRDLPGTSFAEVCDPDPTVWPGPAVDRLVAVESGPEYALVREAVLYASEAAASAALGRVEALVEGCPRVEGRVYSLLRSADEGPLTVGLHYTAGLGGTVWLLVQHDELLLVLSDSGEASEESLPPMADALDRTHEDLWAAVEPALT